MKKNCYQKIYAPIYGITAIVSTFAGINGRENLQFSTMFLISLFLAAMFSLSIVMNQNVCLEFFGNMRVKVEEQCQFLSIINRLEESILILNEN